MNITIIISCATSVCTCIGVLIAVINLRQMRKNHYANHERTSKQATIDFFDELKKNSYDIEKKIFFKYGNNPIVLSELSEEEIFEIKQFLSRLERFSTGVNTGVYDLKIANRLSGSYFINTYYQLKPYIADIRKSRFDNTLYEEFEHMINNLMHMHSTLSYPDGNIEHSKIPEKNTTVIIK